MKTMWRMIAIVYVFSMICCLFAACGENVEDYPELIIGKWELYELRNSNGDKDKISSSEAKKERITFLPDGTCVHGDAVKYWVSEDKLTCLTDDDNYLEYTIVHLDEEELVIKMTNGGYWAEGTYKKVK